MILFKRANEEQHGAFYDAELAIYKVTTVWWPCDDHGRRTAIIVCPGCASAQHLRPEVWKIAEDGTVKPSVDHSQPIRKTDGTVIQDCTFHDFIKLEGWAA